VMLGDIHAFDTVSMTWTQPSLLEPKETSSTGNNQLDNSLAPSARAGHTSTLVGSKLLLFGGGDGAKILNDTWLLDPVNFTWTRPMISGTPPSGRCAHTATLLGGKLIIFGGGDGSRRFKDLYILDIDELLKTEEAKKVKTKKITKKNSKQNFKEESPIQRPKDITSWLQSIGMKKYAEKFIAAEVDVDILPYLTEQHLEQLGITSLGQRIRIMATINKLKEESQNDNEKGELIGLAQTLKEAIETLVTSTNRLSDILHSFPVANHHLLSPNGYSPKIPTETTDHHENHL